MQLPSLARVPPSPWLLAQPLLAAALVAATWPGAADAQRIALVAAHGPWPWDLVAAEPSLPEYPLESVLLGPLLGWGELGVGIGAAAWCAFGGLAMAELCGRWWGRAAAGAVGGVAWQLLLLPALAAGELESLAALALLPLAWGLCLRAFDRPDAAFVPAGLAVAALLQLDDQVLAWVLLLLAAALPVAVRARGLDALAAAVGIVGVVTAAAAPVLAWRGSAEEAAGLAALPGLSPLLVFAAIAGSWLLRHQPPRLLLPLLAVAAGVGLVEADAVAALGLCVLAAGLGLWRPPALRRAAPRHP